MLGVRRRAFIGTLDDSCSLVPPTLLAVAGEVIE